MSAKDNPQDVIDSYKKRQQMMPFLIGAVAVLLVVVGIILLVTSFLGPNRPAIALFASATPTATSTVTPSPTVPSPTATNTATATMTATITNTVTPSGPFEYTVLENDNCFDLAAKYEVDLLVLLAINEFPTGQCPIKVGDKILIPAPGQALPTETPMPNDFRGTIEYVVKPGETLAIIAGRFNSTPEQIMAETNRRQNLNPKWTDANKISTGQIIFVPVNIVTATPTRPATNTAAATTPTVQATLAPSATVTP